MFENNLRILIISACIFGILGILVITYFYDSVKTTPEKLSNIQPNDQIYLVSGYIKNTTVKSNTLFFELCDYFVCIDSVYFNPSAALITELKDGQEITIKAKYSYYNDSPELIVFSFVER